MSSERDLGEDDRSRIESLVDRLSLEEKCALLVGDSAFTVAGCERLDIPGWRLSDGPVGVRGMSAGNSLLFPCETALGATWDTGLMGEVGVALGLEAIDRHVDVLLGPTINLHRSPLGGRHFECFSEDPTLTAELAVAYVEGVQSVGVAACAKHLVCNDQEHERRTIDVQIDEQTLREVYLRPFEAAVRTGSVRTVMAAYNYVNGDHCTAHPFLLEEVLKGEWGFDGVVVSDWGAVKATVPPARHGLDLEMPGPGVWWGDGQLFDAVRDGEVPEGAIDDKVRRVLGLLEWRGRLPGTTVEDEEAAEERPAHRRLARRAATDSMVLVKNDGLLPLPPASSVALIGSGVARTALLGGGSASLEPYRRVDLLEAFTARWDGEVTHAVGVDLHRSCPTIPFHWLEGPVRIEWIDGLDLDGEPVLVEERLAVSNAWFAESIPFKGRGSLRLSFTFRPDRGGPARVMGAGFGPARLLVDDELVTDNEVDGFVAGLGLRGGVASVELEAGRLYSATLAAWSHPSDSTPFFYVDVGVAFEGTQDAQQLADEAVTTAAAADIAVVVVGTNSEWEAEDRDRESLALPMDQDELVRRVARANPRTVVVLNVGSPASLPWLDEVSAVLVAWYPGQEGGAAITDVLVGDAEPSGRMPTTWPHELGDTPSYQWYPGAGGVEPYGEGTLVGHRWYETHGIEPLLAFGHGGSYTTFEWGPPLLSGDRADVKVQVPVRNTGDRSGAEVVQVYLGRRDSTSARATRLAGFAKVRLAPGESAVASVVLDERSFSTYDVAARRWHVPSGPFDIVVAASAVDHRATLSHVVRE
jgi:beta-glucosidase